MPIDKLKIEKLLTPHFYNKMNDSDLLLEFRNKIIEVTRSISPNFPIVGSIGKQSRGKSYFCGKLFNRPISNKLNSTEAQGTRIFYSELFDHFVLLDMEGLENESVSIKRDVFNFCSILTISDIILLHITHEDLENQVFIDTFSFLFWQSSRIAKKHRLFPPQIFLILRDPR